MARASTAPNRGPTSGLVMKSARRPAPAPTAKNPPSPYRASSTKASNRMGPSRAIRAAIASRADTALPAEGEGGELAEVADEPGQDADGQRGDGAQADGGTEGGGHADGRAVLVRDWRHPSLLGDVRVVVE